ncbi:MAG: hypothetical protein QXZ44_06215 [Ferroplasma sp.]
MIKMIDIVAISKMEPEKRKMEMQKVLTGMFTLSDSEKIKDMKAMIIAMENATDEEYSELCLTNIGIASTLPDAQLKAFFELRMKVNSELPSDARERDMKMIRMALQKEPSDISKKISGMMQ